jgi:hypothetical protein
VSQYKPIRSRRAGPHNQDDATGFIGAERAAIESRGEGAWEKENDAGKLEVPNWNFKLNAENLQGHNL